MNTAPLIRPVETRDWDALVEIEADAYTELGLSESREALQSRARLSPGTCFVLEKDGRVAGYLLALPYPAGHHPDLRQPETTAHTSTNLHLHDLVVSPPFRGGGMARRLLEHLADTARTLGYEQLSLIAVGNTQTFWSSRGFTAHPGAVTTGGYDPDAVHMSTTVTVSTPRSSLPTESG